MKKALNLLMITIIGCGFIVFFELFGSVIISTISERNLIGIGISDDYVFKNAKICKLGDMQIDETFIIFPPKNTLLSEDVAYCSSSQLFLPATYIESECRGTEEYIKELAGIGKKIECTDNTPVQICKKGQTFKEFYLRSMNIFVDVKEAILVQCQ